MVDVVFNRSAFSWTSGIFSSGHRTPDRDSGTKTTSDMARDVVMMEREKSGTDVDRKEGVEDKQRDRKKEKTKKSSMRIKVYTFRNSPLTEMMEIDHFKSLHSLIIAAFLLFVFNATLYYVAAAPDKFIGDLSTLKWAAGGLEMAFVIWTGLHVACLFILYPATSYWTSARTRFNTKRVDSIFLVMWISFLILMLVVPAHLVAANEFPPITGGVLMLEQVRILMKVYSFVREIARKVIYQKPEKGGANPQTERPSIRAFIYFLFAPCLLYRDSYPRTKTIRWSFVFSQLWQFLACIFTISFLFCRVNLDVLSKVDFRKISFREFCHILPLCIFAGSSAMFLVFYLLFHCWLNAFAEILRFGDRMFYQDWWNYTSTAQHLRKWNVFIYDWLYTYVYADMYEISGSKFASSMAVFVLSGTVHEYIITFTFGFLYPLVSTIYGIAVVSGLFLKAQMRSQSAMIFIWIMQFLSWSFFFCGYSMEWYVRKTS